MKKDRQLKKQSGPPPPPPFPLTFYISKSLKPFSPLFTHIFEGVKRILLSKLSTKNFHQQSLPVSSYHHQVSTCHLAHCCHLTAGSSCLLLKSSQYSMSGEFPSKGSQPAKSSCTSSTWKDDTTSSWSAFGALLETKTNTQKKRSYEMTEINKLQT